MFVKVMSKKPFSTGAVKKTFCSGSKSLFMKPSTNARHPERAVSSGAVLNDAGDEKVIRPIPEISRVGDLDLRTRSADR